MENGPAPLSLTDVRDLAVQQELLFLELLRGEHDLRQSGWTDQGQACAKILAGRDDRGFAGTDRRSRKNKERY